MATSAEWRLYARGGRVQIHICCQVARWGTRGLPLGVRVDVRVHARPDPPSSDGPQGECQRDGGGRQARSKDYLDLADLAKKALWRVHVLRQTRIALLRGYSRKRRTKYLLSNSRSRKVANED